MKTSCYQKRTGTVPNYQHQYTMHDAQVHAEVHAELLSWHHTILSSIFWQNAFIISFSLPNGTVFELTQVLAIRRKQEMPNMQDSAKDCRDVLP